MNAFSRADADALASLYAEDAVTRHVAYEPPYGRPPYGRAAIRGPIEREFSRATMICQVENLFADGDGAILEGSDSPGLRGCGFFQVQDRLIVFQRGYFDKVSDFKIQGSPLEDALK